MTIMFPLAYIAIRSVFFHAIKLRVKLGMLMKSECKSTTT